MKKATLLFIVFIAIASQTLNAQDYKMGLGIRLSSSGPAVNNSVSFKYFLNSKNAIEGLLTIDKNAALGFLFEVHRDIPSAEGLKWFYGGGAYLGFASNKDDPARNLLGAQGVVGLDYKFTNLPLNLALDWKPELNIIDNINFEPAAIGFTIRFVFGPMSK